jgi:long-chain acyl-CoA synthetase
VLRKLRCLADKALRDVASWERMKKIAILPEPLSVANDELTVTLKMRRKVILGRHATLLEALYRDEPPGVEEA